MNSDASLLQKVAEGKNEEKVLKYLQFHDNLLTFRTINVCTLLCLKVSLQQRVMQDKTVAGKVKPACLISTGLVKSPVATFIRS